MVGLPTTLIATDGVDQFFTENRRENLVAGIKNADASVVLHSLVPPFLKIGHTILSFNTLEAPESFSFFLLETLVA